MNPSGFGFETVRNPAGLAFLKPGWVWVWLFDPVLTVGTWQTQVQGLGHPHQERTLQPQRNHRPYATSSMHANLHVVLHAYQCMCLSTGFPESSRKRDGGDTCGGCLEQQIPIEAHPRNSRLQLLH